jgi:hypothetical protein
VLAGVVDMATTSLKVIFERHKADKDLGGNSRASWRTIRRKNKSNENTAFIQTTKTLRDIGFDSTHFLTNKYSLPFEQALPLKVICRRVFCHPANQWDTDNLAGCFKGFLDGVSGALVVNDKSFRPSYEQIRTKDETRLEIEIIPAWAVEKGEAA